MITNFNPIIDESFREYAKLELQRHFLLLSKNENSDELERMELRMEELWQAINETQKQCLKGMGSDLNWIRRNCQPPPKGPKTPTEVAKADQMELAAAIKQKDWHRVLHYLRVCAPIFRSASVAAERATAYAAIGLDEYAKVFHSQAIESETPISSATGSDYGSLFAATATVPNSQAITNQSRIIVTDSPQQLRKGDTFTYRFPSVELQAA